MSNEDIHMAVEGRLHRAIGPVATHTARSRNDQVATMFVSGCVIDWLTSLLVERSVFCLRPNKMDRFWCLAIHTFREDSPFGLGISPPYMVIGRDLERLRSAMSRLNVLLFELPQWREHHILFAVN